MKQLMTIGCLFATVLLGAQVQGNYQNVQAESAGNYLSSDAHGNYRPNPVTSPTVNKPAFAADNVLVINMNGLSNHTADGYTAIFSVFQLGKTAEEADQLMSSRINGFMDACVAAGISKESFVTDMISFLPRYEMEVTKKIFRKKTYTEEPVGFQIQKNVHVKMTNAMQLDKLVTMAARQEIYDLVKVDYFVNEPEKISKALREKVFAAINDLEVQYKKIGVVLDSAYITTAETRGVVYPKNRYVKYQAFSSVSMEALDKNSNVTRADKVTTSFYDALSAEGFDVVINPTIVEPAVQYTYQFTIKYQLKERVPFTKTITNTKKEFYMVTPAGQVTTLKVE